MCCKPFCICLVTLLFVLDSDDEDEVFFEAANESFSDDDFKSAKAGNCCAFETGNYFIAY